jgi:hypothetical protein
MRAQQKTVQVKLDSITITVLKALINQIEQSENQHNKRCLKDNTPLESGQLALFVELDQREGEEDH